MGLSEELSNVMIQIKSIKMDVLLFASLRQVGIVSILLLLLEIQQPVLQFVEMVLMLVQKYVTTVIYLMELDVIQHVQENYQDGIVEEVMKTQHELAMSSVEMES